MEVTNKGLALMAGGCLPFALGALTPENGIGLLPPCAFRTLTGLPCPMCGATRAFTHVARGDAAFLHYNAFWVLVAVVTVLAGVLVLITRRPFVDALTNTPRRAMAMTVLVVGAGWAYALSERATIVPS